MFKLHCNVQGYHWIDRYFLILQIFLNVAEYCEILSDLVEYCPILPMVFHGCLKVLPECLKNLSGLLKFVSWVFHWNTVSGCISVFEGYFTDALRVFEVSRVFQWCIASGTLSRSILFDYWFLPLVEHYSIRLKVCKGAQERQSVRFPSLALNILLYQ